MSAENRPQQPIRPMKGGVVCDYDITKKMLCYCLAHEKVKKARKGGFRRPRVVFAVPSGITEVEKRALEDAAQSAGAGDVWSHTFCRGISALLHTPDWAPRVLVLKCFQSTIGDEC